MRNASIVRLLLTHFLAMIGEWAVTIGLLVQAYEWGGSRAVGLASMTVLLPPLLTGPLVARALAHWRTLTIRIASLVIQIVAYGFAAICASVGAPTPIVAVSTAIGVAVLTAVPPTSAALVPRAARSANELVNANLWLTHCDSSSALVGSLLAGLVVGIGGPETVFAVAAGGAAVGTAASIWRPGPLVRTAQGQRSGEQRRLIRQVLREVRASPWSIGVLSLTSSRNLIVGTFDVVLVVIALDVLDMGSAGAGYLGALVGGGAFASTLVTATAVRRARLGPTLVVVSAIAATAAIVLGLRTDRLVVFVLLPVVGICMASMDSLGRTLLQRSTDPRSLGALFAALGMVAATGQITGSILAQTIVAVAEPEHALVALGVLVALGSMFAISSLRRADEHAAVPVVEMALLAGIPMLASLPTSSLEAVARSTTTVQVRPGEAIARAGERADSCFVIASGELELTANGARVRVASRGDVINDVALLASITASTDVVATSAATVVRVERDPFLLAVTGFTLDDDIEDTDYAGARRRFRETMENHRRSPEARRADTWLSIGAAGRLLGDNSFVDAVAESASLAIAEQNTVLLAEAAALSTHPGAFFNFAENPDHEMIAICEAALAVLPSNDIMRPRVLAALATNLTFLGGPERRRAIIDEALQLAEAHEDPELVGLVLNAEFICLWEPSTLDRREEIAQRLQSIAETIGDEDLAYLSRFFAAYCATERGRLREARRALVELEDFAGPKRTHYFEFLVARLTLAIDIALEAPDIRPRIDSLAERHGATSADTEGTWALQLGVLAYQEGELGSMVPFISTMLDSRLAKTWRAGLAYAHLMNGDAEAAEAELAERGDVPRNYFWITIAQIEAEVAAALALHERCRSLYDDLLPYRGRLGVISSGTACFALVSRSLGVLALALGRLDEAHELLTEAAAQASEIGMRFESVVSRRMLATAVRARGDHAESVRIAVDASADAVDGGYAREERLLRDFLA